MSENPDALSAVYDALCAHFGQRPGRASVSFLGVDPIDVLRFEPIPGELAYLTLGTSRHPMTSAAAQNLTTDGPRAELMLHTRSGVDTSQIWRRLAVLGAAPAVEGVVYTAGMTVDLGLPITAGSRCTGVVVSESRVGRVTTDGGVVDILQVTPATSTELAWCRIKGSQAIWRLWTDQSVDLLDLGRPAAILEGPGPSAVPDGPGQ